MYLLDTNVVAELRKVKRGNADPSVRAWNDGVDPGNAYLSAITILELERGILQLERRDVQQGLVLRRWMDEQVLPTFGGRVLAIDAVIALRCAQLHVPDPRPERDALIAATALVHGMIVVTRNVADFDVSGVEVLNPWEWTPGYVALHTEIENILNDHSNEWMTSAEVADAVNLRRRYCRWDGTQVPPSQVAARARSYAKVFECRLEGSSLRIRLRQAAPNAP